MNRRELLRRLGGLGSLAILWPFQSFLPSPPPSKDYHQDFIHILCEDDLIPIFMQQMAEAAVKHLDEVILREL